MGYRVGAPTGLAVADRRRAAFRSAKEVCSHQVKSTSRSAAPSSAP